MSSVLVLLERSSAVLVMISSKTVSITDRSHARRPNSGKIRISYQYPYLMPSFVENLVTQQGDSLKSKPQESEN